MHTKKNHRDRAWLLLVLCLLQLWLPAATTGAQTPEPPTAPQVDPAISQLIAAMTPEQRVAQLFLVTFPGTDLADSSMAETLVRDLRVGGVVLRASNGNYTNEDATTPSALTALTNGLQTLAQEASIAEGGGPYIPPFVALDLASPTAQYADGIPHSGFTRIPSEMAIGATWEPANAEAVGRIVGQELGAVGVNMLLGPALDVVDSPRPEQQATRGIRTFGGDPFWVGEMGQAFVRGVRAVGRGGSRRWPAIFPAWAAAIAAPTKRSPRYKRSGAHYSRRTCRPSSQ